MKKLTPGQWVRLLAGPVMTILLGLVLLFTPDTASALIGQLLAWLCLLCGAFLSAGVIFGAAGKRVNRILWAVIGFSAGIWMLRNPLIVAEFLGRVLGFTLMLLGARSVADQIRSRSRKPLLSRGMILSGATLVVGAVLAILPMASSRLLFNIIGICLISLGIAQGWDNLRGRKLLDSGDDPKIIDVEKL